jgi:hypothetical protein
MRKSKKQTLLSPARSDWHRQGFRDAHPGTGLSLTGHLNGDLAGMNRIDSLRRHLGSIAVPAQMPEDHRFQTILRQGTNQLRGLLIRKMPMS